MNRIVFAAGLLAASAAVPAIAGTPCDEVKAGIARQLDGNGVKAYTLDAVAAAQVKDQKAVGVCEGGARKIVYARGGTAKAAAADPAPVPAKAAPAPAPAAKPKS